MQPDFNVYTFYKQMQVQNIILSFKGVVSQDLLSRLAASLRGKSLGHDPHIGRKIFGIFIELSQNVSLHSSEKSYSIKEDQPLGVGFLLVGEADDHYLVSSSNKIANDQVEHVLGRSACLNDLNKDELKDFIKTERRKPQRDNKPGANIGLADMIKRSNNPIDVHAYPFDDKDSVLTVSVRLDKNETK